MKRKKYAYFTSLFVFLCLTSHVYPQKKIACIGNSITAGVGVSDGNNSYPSVLQRNLGTASYEVCNFGASGYVMSRQPEEISYWNHPNYQEVLNWQPDIVVIKLGTNDAEPARWDVNKYDFKATYTEMVHSLQALPSRPEIYTCFPIPLCPPTWAANEKNLIEEVIPLIAEVAAETGCTVIDLHTPMEGRAHMTPDLAHPNEQGAILIAHVVANAICPDCTIPNLPEDLFLRISAFDQTDKSSDLSSSLSNIDIRPLTDNNASTGVNAPFVADTWFMVAYEEEVKITTYSITTGSSDEEKSNPKSWTLEGSKDGTTWVELDKQTDKSFYAHDTRTFDLEYRTITSLAGYRYYRLTIHENNGGENLSIREWQLFGSAATLASSVTANGGTITDKYNTTGTTGVQTLIDQRLNTKYVVDNGLPVWIQYVSPEPVKLGKYALTNCNVAPGYDPVEWTFLASTDGVQWDILDTKVNQDFIGRYTTNEYPVKCDKEYTIFRINITKVKNGQTVQLAQWQLVAEDLTGVMTGKDTRYQVFAVNNQIHITSQSPEILKYEVFSISGQCMASGSVASGEETIVECFSGIYLISLTSPSGEKVTLKTTI